MRYVMKQKLFSWGDDFVIKDENGNEVFFVDGKAFSLRCSLVMVLRPACRQSDNLCGLSQPCTRRD